jgi:hypothetical protein
MAHWEERQLVVQFGIANMNTWNQKIVLVTNSLTYDKTLNV